MQFFEIVIYKFLMKLFGIQEVKHLKETYMNVLPVKITLIN